VGITAAEPFDPASRIVMRVRQDGEWLPWMELPVSEHMPDPATEEGQRARYASEPVVTLDMFGAAERRREGRPLVVLDLAMPRDFDPRIGGRPGVWLYSIDDLGAACEANRKSRQREMPT
jgi:hypothetical protein